jgi:phage pre-neck appendage-like protein
MTGQEKKIRISELPASVTFRGLWTIGYQMVEGKKTSVRVSLAEIQQVYDDVVAATETARTATTDMRQLEAQVEGKEEERENFYSRSQALVQGWSNDEQARKYAEAERDKKEAERIQGEAAREEEEAKRVETEKERIVEEELRKKAEDGRKAEEVIRQKQEDVRETETTKALLNAEAATDRLNALSDHRDEIRDGYWWRWNEETGEWYNTGEIAKGNVMFASFEVDPASAILTMCTDEEYTGANFELDENGILTVVI